MNKNIKGMIGALADNDVQRAKAFARAVLNSDNTGANKCFKDSALSKLNGTSFNLVELPANIKTLMTAEDVSASFNEARYHLTSSESKLYDKIETAVRINGKLFEMGIPYLNSVLLHGESGTGKTTFGRYTAYKLGVPFMYMNFSYCVDSHLGDTGKNIAKVFDYAKTQRCVLMLDELDAIGIRRGDKAEVGEMSRVVIGLMQAMDCLHNDIVLLAATNRYDVLDEALIRRFTVKHEVKPFEYTDTVAFISQYLKNLKIEYDVDDLLLYARSAGRYGKQSEIVNDVVSAIICMLKDGTKFKLPGETA